MSVARVVHQSRSIRTDGRALIEISEHARVFCRQESLQNGMCQVFVRHTSASLLITENADSDVLHDLETVLAGLAPDGDARYRHHYEGADDMAAHVRSVLTQTSLSVPVMDGELMLGTWQGMFLWEHRYRAQQRELIFSLIGDFAEGD